MAMIFGKVEEMNCLGFSDVGIDWSAGCWMAGSWGRMRKKGYQLTVGSHRPWFTGGVFVEYSMARSQW